MEEPSNYRVPTPPEPGYILLPCPFCGGNRNVKLEHPGDYYVRCWDCSTRGTDAPNANWVIWQWNRRAPSPDADEITRLQNIIDEQSEVIDDYRIALERCEETLQFTHRNGETEPPTVAGFYWVHKPDKRLPDTSIVKAHDWGRGMIFRLLGSEQEADNEDFKGYHWYGPLIPPFSIEKGSQP